MIIVISVWGGGWALSGGLPAVARCGLNSIVIYGVIVVFVRLVRRGCAAPPTSFVRVALTTDGAADGVLGVHDGLWIAVRLSGGRVGLRGQKIPVKRRNNKISAQQSSQ